MKYSDEQRIQKILMYSKKLNDYIEENGITKEKLMREYALQWLVTTPLYNIGEHAYYISRIQSGTQRYSMGNDLRITSPSCA